MKRLLVIMVNGNSMPELLMHIIRFVMPSKNKELKKLLHFYWEICPKLQPDGTLKQEMILVCNAIRNDLQHPNEYIRGETLRFLCKLREADLLDPLIPSILSCLEHRHAYVRKNAVFAVYSIASYASHHIPDAAELINTFLETETDATCIRNAFVALSNLDRDRAFSFLQQKYQTIATQDELLQLAFIEFIRRDAIQNPDLKKSYLSIMFDILESSSNTAIYEAAIALTKLSSDPNAIKGAASKLVELAVKEPDNNVKLIVFDRVEQLHLQNPNTLNDLTMDILVALSSPDLDVRKKVLKIALGMVSSRNVDDVVNYLKKELTKTINHNYDKNSEYRQLLIQAIHTCAIRFAEVAASVVDLLLDFIGDSNSTAAVDVISFVKEVVEIFPNLRASILSRLLQTIETVRASGVYRGALWIIGEYSLEEQDIQEAWIHIRKSLGEVPILASERRLLSAGEEEESVVSKPAEHHKPKVLADGTYATESAFSSEAQEEHKANRPPLRNLILSGNYFVAAVLSSTLTKLVLRYQKISSNEARKNALRAEALLIMTSILRVSESEIVTQKMDEDTSERIFSCIKVLAEGYKEPVLEKAFLEDSKAAFKVIVQAQEKQRAETNALEKKKNATQVDESVVFRQFAQTTIATTPTDDLEQDIARASGTSKVSTDKPISKLSRVVQLTGYSDSVYVEAFVNVHQFDIVLDVLIFNQTFDTLQNLYVEFATLGDLKVFSQPTPHNVGPQSFHSIQATIKVSSADAGVIFGNVIYEGHSGSDGNIVILNDVHVDIMDYIKPGHYNETEFRTMWSEFEWENKVNISVQWKSLRGFLAYLMKNTNMNCLTNSALGDGGEEDEDDCQFLSANLHARSTFGEDALANLSIEKDSNGKITGHVRIRSKGQGLALSLGDRVAELQRQHVSATASKKALAS